MALHSSAAGAPTTGVVIPIRAFGRGKVRLSAHLDDATRTEAIQRMAEQVVGAAVGLPLAVVSSAPEVRHWARSLGLRLLADPGSLDGAASAGRRWAHGEGLARVIIAHADLPLARSFDSVRSAGDTCAIVAVPCHRGDGTTVLSVPAGVAFRFAYGPGSFRRHEAEAHRLGLPFSAVHDRELSFDVDFPEDFDRIGTLDDRTDSTPSQ